MENDYYLISPFRLTQKVKTLLVISPIYAILYVHATASNNGMNEMK
jgi:hypothetical protein